MENSTEKLFFKPDVADDKVDLYMNYVFIKIFEW